MKQTWRILWSILMNKEEFEASLEYIDLEASVDIAYEFGMVLVSTVEGLEWHDEQGGCS